MATHKEKFRAAYVPRPPVVLSCRRCGETFVGPKSKWYCSPACRDQSRVDAVVRFHATRAERQVREGGGSTWGPRHWYVYGWYDEALPDLPFYVGMGTGRRAWATHRQEAGDDGVRRAACERYRTAKTRVVVYRDNLTEEGARLAESVLTAVFTRMCAPLTHQCEPMRRREVPPLTMPE